MSSLQKRGKRWYIKFTRTRNGVREERKLSLGTNWKSVAEDLQKTLDQKYDRHKIDPFNPHFDIEVALGAKKPKQERPKTFDECSKVWLQTKKKLAQATYRTYEHRINSFIDYSGIRHKLVKVLNADMVEAFIFRDGINSVSVNSDARHLSVFFNYLVKKDWIKKNPLDSIDIPDGSVDYFQKMLRPEEFKKLQITFHKHQKDRQKKSYHRDFHNQEWFLPMLATYYYGGFRLHEIAYSNRLSYSGLKLNNIIQDDSMIWIPVSKGRKERFVPISKHLEPFLTSYLDLRKPKELEDYIFIHLNGPYKNKPVTGYAFREAFNEYCALAKIPNTRTCHGMRHQAITNWIQNGFSVKEAAMMAGNSTRITDEVYTHLAYKEIGRKMRKIEGE